MTTPIREGAGRRAGRVESPEPFHLEDATETRFKATDSLSPHGTHSSPRVGARMLHELRADLSLRDLTIVRLVSDYRYLNAGQIVRLCFLGHASRATGERKARQSLQRLTAQRVLVRLPRPIGGIRAGSLAYVYGLGPVGHRLLVADGSRSRWKEPSVGFVAHTLAIAELSIQLQAEHGGPGEPRTEHENSPAGRSTDGVSVVTEPDCWRSFRSGSFAAREVLKPDLSVVLVDGEYEYRWFVEMDLGTESSTAIRKKAEVYLRYLHTGSEQADVGIFPKVLWVARDARRVQLLQDTLTRMKHVPDGLFTVTETNNAVAVLIGGQP